MTQVQAQEAVSVTGKGTMKGREGEIQLVYIAPDGAKTQVAGQDSEKIDATIKLSAGQGLFRFDGENAVCDFEFQFGPVDGVSYKWDEPDALNISEVIEPAQQRAGESDTFHQVIRAVYGGDFIVWPAPETGHRIAMLASGIGDGIYSGYWGAGQRRGAGGENG